MTVMASGPTCGKIVEGNAVSFLCTLDANHEGPCAAVENKRSMREREAWETAQRNAESGLAQFQGAAQTTAQRYTENPTDPPETVVERTERQAAQHRAAQAIERARTRPDVLAANDDLIRAGVMHNPYDVACQRRDHGGDVLDDERCYICRPAGQESQPLPPSEPEPPVEASHLTCPHEFCNAEVVHRHEEGGPIYSPRTRMQVEDVPLPEPVPTKQREGDQPLPTPTGGEYVQDRIIAKAREVHRMGGMDDAQLGFVESIMQESMRVGTERYGTPLQVFNGRNTLQDAADEARDMLVYLSSLVQACEVERPVLVEAISKVMHQQWMTWANDGQQHTPTEYCQRLAEIAVDTIHGAVGPVGG